MSITNTQQKVIVIDSVPSTSHVNVTDLLEKIFEIKENGGILKVEFSDVEGIKIPVFTVENKDPGRGILVIQTNGTENFGSDNELEVVEMDRIHTVGDNMIVFEGYHDASEYPGITIKMKLRKSVEVFAEDHAFTFSDLAVYGVSAVASGDWWLVTLVGVREEGPNCKIGVNSLNPVIVPS